MLEPNAGHGRRWRTRHDPPVSRVSDGPWRRGGGLVMTDRTSVGFHAAVGDRQHSQPDAPRPTAGTCDGPGLGTTTHLRALRR